MPVSLQESSDFASPHAHWKYDSHAARHMWPPTLLWDIDPLFIEVARPVTLDSAQTFSFDQPQPPPLLKSSERVPTHAGLAGGGCVFLGGGRRGRLRQREQHTERERRGEKRQRQQAKGPRVRIHRDEEWKLTDRRATVYTCSSPEAVRGLVPGEDQQEGLYYR